MSVFNWLLSLVRSGILRLMYPIEKVLVTLKCIEIELLRFLLLINIIQTSFLSYLKLLFKHD